MSEGGAIFSDGLVEDFVPFNGGAAVSIGSAPQRVRVVVEAPHVARPIGKAKPIARPQLVLLDRDRIRR
jgi:hypothetical protein